MSSSDPTPDLRPVNMDDFLKAIPTVKRTGSAAEQYAQEGLNGTVPYLTIFANSLAVGKLFLTFMTPMKGQDNYRTQRRRPVVDMNSAQKDITMLLQFFAMMMQNQQRAERHH